MQRTIPDFTWTSARGSEVSSPGLTRAVGGHSRWPANACTALRMLHASREVVRHALCVALLANDVVEMDIDDSKPEHLPSKEPG